MTKRRVIQTIILPLLIGGLTYILFRADSLVMFRWFDKLGLGQIIYSIRQITYGHDILPTWFLFSLPDALWVFAFTNCMLVLWQDRFTLHSTFWILLAPTIGIFSELGQAINFIPGTFDLTDLLLLITASLLPFIKIHNTTTKFKLI